MTALWAISTINWNYLRFSHTCFARRKVREISKCCRNCSQGGYSYFTFVSTFLTQKQQIKQQQNNTRDPNESCSGLKSKSLYFLTHDPDDGNSFDARSINGLSFHLGHFASTVAFTFSSQKLKWRFCNDRSLTTTNFVPSFSRLKNDS